MPEISLEISRCCNFHAAFATRLRPATTASAKMTSSEDDLNQKGATPKPIVVIPLGPGRRTIARQRTFLRDVESTTINA
jgi:hypothetical protein